MLGDLSWSTCQFGESIPVEGLTTRETLLGTTIGKSMLGLDLSKTSTGLTVIRDGIIAISTNFSFNYDGEEDGLAKSDPLLEVKTRRVVKSKILEAIGDIRHFEIIRVEDVYSGVDPKESRMLYAINTAVDELILDGLITCTTFSRVNNQVWKRELFELIPNEVYDSTLKGYNDKLKIEKALAHLGFSDSGKGYQDRLDSLGLLVSTLEGTRYKRSTTTTSNKALSVKEVGCAIVSDRSTLMDSVPFDIEECEVVTLTGRFSKRAILDTLLLEKTSEDVGIKRLFVTYNSVKLGTFARDLGLHSYEGFCCFWLK